MASTTKQAARAALPLTDRESFAAHLKTCRRIVALVGAGLSAASGLPTFRGAGGLWRTHDATDLATPEAFDENPDLVWQFYSFRRHMALKAAPNKGHYALAELSRKNRDFITLSQNVDGLSQRAQHPSEQLHLLHGSLFNIKCTDFYCKYTREDFTDPIVPALAIPKKSSLKNNEKKEEKVVAQQTDKPDDDQEKKTEEDQKVGDEKKECKEENKDESDEEIDISDISNHIPNISNEELPQCPDCKGLLRPGVVWFGEPLPTTTLETVENWMGSESIDLMLVIGTSAQVYPAADYVDEARDQGARVAVINMEPYSPKNPRAVPLQETDWFFEGDASVILPDILKGVIGEI
ncbi:Sirtuin family [Penicillium waksmanii]|uniref:Sirtuin family n=1 Tax=Penicillium waksmanii TaxID=69791 RepID=UPI0025466114|nr:Sirtuin family [Penicillium waksmanii]KAJ5983560.1 Sirtuin family [Penicillium waksmanii]